MRTCSVATAIQLRCQSEGKEACVKVVGLFFVVLILCTKAGVPSQLDQREGYQYLRGYKLESAFSNPLLRWCRLPEPGPTSLTAVLILSLDTYSLMLFLP